ncbi:MAG: dienelactone hydrolase family protein [Rickettsiales bacterium]
MLNGPEIAPRSGNSPKNLVIFMHGVGADGENISDICNVLNRCVPDTHFLCPNGPFHYDMGMGGYQWFSLQDRTESVLLEGINKALPKVNEYIDYHLNKFNLTDDNLAIMGFSQGCMMALHLGLRRPNPPACVIGFSGALVGGEWLKTQKTNSPPIVMAHGDQDQVVELHRMEQSVQILETMNKDIEPHIFKGLAHGMNEDSLTLAADSLKKHLNQI